MLFIKTQRLIFNFFSILPLQRKEQNTRFFYTDKCFSEALILASVNPQYDKRFFIEFPEKYKFRTCRVQKSCFCFDIQNNICTELVLNLHISGNSMNNLSSYRGLTDPRNRASDTDLPVLEKFICFLPINEFCLVVEVTMDL